MGLRVIEAVLTFFNQGPLPKLKGESLGWFLRPEALEQFGEYLSGESKETKQACREIIENGLTALPGVLSPEDCDRIWNDYQSFVKNSTEESKFRDQHGLHSRLCNFHGVSSFARDAATHPRITKILDTLFGREACVYSSLTFEKSTQQMTHRDCPFFYTQPEDLFFGVWFALEDVCDDAGPLFYYPQGHLVPIDEKEIGKRHEKGEESAIGKSFDEYTKSIQAACEAQGKAQRLRLKKGDVVIWHPRLPHGGSAIDKPGKSRKSMVLHFIPLDIPLYGIGEYFLPDQNPIKPKTHRYLKHKNRSYIDQGAPHFDVNN